MKMYLCKINENIEYKSLKEDDIKIFDNNITKDDSTV